MGSNGVIQTLVKDCVLNLRPYLYAAVADELGILPEALTVLYIMSYEVPGGFQSTLAFSLLHICNNKQCYLFSTVINNRAEDTITEPYIQQHSLKRPTQTTKQDCGKVNVIII